MTGETRNQSKVVWVAEAGLLIALLIVVQLLTFAVPKGVPLIGQLFTGSLVNLVLIVGAGSVGFSGTAIAAVLSPVLAFAFGQMTFPQMIPVVALGNLVIVAVTWAFFHRENRKTGTDILGVVLGAVLKTAFLWLATAAVMVPVFFAAVPTVGKKLTLMFSWPQLVTALIGGMLALLIFPAVRSYRGHRNG